MGIATPIAGQLRSSPRVRTPLFLVGIALALLAFIAMFAFGIVFVNRSQGGRQIAIVMAAQDIQAREPILPDMLSVANVPAAALPPKAFFRLADVSGYSAVVTIFKGQPITSNVVASNPDVLAGASTYLPIPQGYVAITVPTSEQQGVAGYIAQGDYINVIATVNSATFTPSNPRSVTRTVFSNLHVIRVGPLSAAPKEGQPQGVVGSLTVVMSLCDAQFMNWLLVNASLKYVLLSFHDYTPGTPAAPETACLSTVAPAVVGPHQVDARWGFSTS
ncbi:MAG: Flp pilus assembly protein CpaB [Actinobacteria bacterium 13_1_20CM_2_65_11]|nr:MAG: Flp pilus assembly protein CpaB [Chloroflexi bacterium 13_1_40CM_65_17]OLC67529.1 MAG: Flp pilus assembly protein CpaB [Actinobacteria bacterium 13_1_40CM_4_65_12]OLD23948.1 MAG: Flp pilus assembly protein CpaB [Chloroflexi bacterium 13_1_40CM_3_65_12]OLD49463.1 MAG: Flp pilus assembly protein CpaB [Actinobacteria bacterium 13_1_40CM_2_65_8]OLE80312.1 MAG: Flp pilus assembly protein CpaB [Actinobacteria bacterium 13_1_20CM_2_65_11]